MEALFAQFMPSFFAGGQFAVMVVIAFRLGKVLSVIEFLERRILRVEQGLLKQGEKRHA